MDSFLSSLKPAAELFLGHAAEGHPVRILTHNDADGVASGGILVRATRRAGAGFRVTVEKRLDEGVLSRVASERPRLVVICDFGSGYLELIGRILPELDVIVLDHHLVNGAPGLRTTHVNPLLHGIDGAREISAAGVCYLFAEAADPGNRDSAHLAVVGALGDQQDKGEKGSLVGLNTVIQREAKEAGLLRQTMGIAFYGYETRPLARAMSYTTDPFIPGLSGREDACVAFLDRFGIPLKRDGRLRSMADLGEEEQRRLLSSLSSHMVGEGCDADSVRSLVGWIYTVPRELAGTSLRDGREYASLLNACARMRKSGVGIGITLGDRGPSLREAEETVDEYRRKIGEYLDWVRQGDKVREFCGIYVLNAGRDVDENIIGVVSGILLAQGLLDRRKPVVSSAYSDDGTAKISARGTEEVVSRGIHLGKIMQEAAKRFGGEGGGHDVAAGAYIPQGMEEEFMRAVDEIVSGYGF